MERGRSDRLRQPGNFAAARVARGYGSGGASWGAVAALVAAGRCPAFTAAQACLDAAGDVTLTLNLTVPVGVPVPPLKLQPPRRRPLRRLPVLRLPRLQNRK